MALDRVTRFKIPSRSCCNVFKLSASLEKAVNKCRLMLSSDDTVFVVQFFCRYGVVKTYNMSIVDCEHLEAVYSLEQSANRLVITTKVLTEVLNNFRQSSEEITILVKDGECIFQNYILQGGKQINLYNHNQILTQLPLSASEFDAYLVGCVSELTFCQRELRVRFVHIHRCLRSPRCVGCASRQCQKMFDREHALLAFCELISPIVRIYCDRPGRPIIFACAHETRLSANFVLATLPPDSYSASDSQRSQSVQPHLLASKTPVQISRVSQPSTTF
ncbi:Rad9, partial [Opisthorchis viverrini]